MQRQQKLAHSSKDWGTRLVTGRISPSTTLRTGRALSDSDTHCLEKGEEPVAEVKIQDGILKVTELDVQDPRVVKILEEYPPNRWCEITRRAIKIGLGYLQGGAQD